MNNVDLIKQGYADFAAGNMEAVLAVWHPKIVWRGSTGMPFVKGDGVVVGGMNIINEMFAPLSEHFDNFNHEFVEVFGAGDKVTVVLFTTGIYKKTGKPFKANSVHVWTIKDGKATDVFLAVDSGVFH